MTTPPAGTDGDDASSRHLRSYATTFGRVVLQGRLVVPLNQRPWEWRSEQLDDLFDDLAAAADRASARAPDGTRARRSDGDPLPHFFGPVVLERGPAGEMSVVDGQQRLTAATVLVAVMRDRTEALRSGPPATRTAARALGTALASWLQADPEGGSPESRLRLDSTVSDFFEQYVVQAASEEERAILRAADTSAQADDDGADVRAALVEAVSHMSARLDGHLDEHHPDGNPAGVLSRVERLFETLKDRFETVVIEVLAPGLSPQLFSGLNARGTPLDEADKVKNELFVVSPELDHAQAKQEWDRMVRAGTLRRSCGSGTSPSCKTPGSRTCTATSGGAS